MTDQHSKIVALTERDQNFIASQIAEGEYNSASEVVRAGLRVLK
jgi:putative addiction module CopG family antidote